MTAQKYFTPEMYQKQEYNGIKIKIKKVFIAKNKHRSEKEFFIDPYKIINKIKSKHIIDNEQSIINFIQDDKCTNINLICKEDFKFAIYKVYVSEEEERELKSLSRSFSIYCNYNRKF